MTYCFLLSQPGTETPPEGARRSRCYRPPLMSGFYVPRGGAHGRRRRSVQVKQPDVALEAPVGSIFTAAFI